MVREDAAMIDLFTAAKQLQDFCDRQGWQSCFIGGIAMQRWCEPRVTRDIDLTLLAGFGDEERFAQSSSPSMKGELRMPRPSRRRTAFFCCAHQAG
ncbi:MAG: hypothetical protein ABSB67_24380 [Bryobacteraceae bacterium]